MNATDARRLVAMIAAAFPIPPMPEATFALYVDQLQKLNNPAAAGEAIEGLILSARWLPKIADIREAYQRRAEAYAEWREALAREEAREFSQTHGLPSGEDREPIPAETVEWLREHGIDVAGLIKRTDAA